ncbi:MAG: hypothetical protein ACTHZ5_02285 [Micrococcaceae bacterium]
MIVINGTQQRVVGEDSHMGDPVCWLSRVCPECGAMLDDGAVQNQSHRTCWRCGYDLNSREVDLEIGSDTES